MESMAGSFWVGYFIIVSLVLVSGVFYWVIRRYSPLAAIALVLSLLLPLVTFVYSVQRAAGTEYEYIKANFHANDWLAISLTVGYAYIIIWLIVVTVDLLIKVSKIPAVNKKLKLAWSKVAPYWDKFISYTEEWINKLQDWLKKLKAKLPTKKNDDERFEEQKRDSQ